MLQKILEVSQGRRGGVLDHGDTQRQLVEQDVPPLPRPQEGEQLVTCKKISLECRQI